MRSILVPLAVLIASAPASAKVVRATDAGFDIRHEALVAATPDAVYAVLIEPRRWWSKAHSWSGDSGNLTLDARPGGCFCEKLPGGGVEHMRVVYAAPGKLLRMTGALGPMQGEAASATMTVELRAAPAGTLVMFRYVVGGYLAMGAASIAPAVDGVLAEQLAGLKRASEAAR
jgi:uncharacterized protein YndB with AHSA1/START domain